MAIRISAARPDTAAKTRDWLWQHCLTGRMPAEVLSTEDREHLVHTLWKRGWTDVEIAAHTLTTTYTTARIRSRLKLAAHRPAARAG